MENKVNVVVPKDYNGNPIEVVMREGEATKLLDPKEPQTINIDGVISSPLKWLEKRVELIEQKKAHILVDRDNMVITLTTEEENYYKSTIIGRLEVSKEVQSFGINTDETWEPQKLGQFFKMHRAFFKDKYENMALVNELKSFKAKISQDISKSKEENGSKTDNFSQVVDSNLPSSFKICIPLFKGFAPEEIEVETYADIDGRDVTLSLISAGANETMEESRDKLIDDVLKEIMNIAPDIVIIEI